MVRTGYRLAGFAALALGMLGLFLPLLPTVPFVILAAFCFARSDRRIEAWLVAHPRYGPHIEAWRSRGAISRRGKIAAFVALAASAAAGLLLLPLPWALLPATAAAISGAWIWSRPD